MVSLERIDTDWRNVHGDHVPVDAPAMKDDALEWGNLIVPWFSRINERCWEFVEGQVWVVGMEKEIILKLWYFLTLVVWKADESRKWHECDNKRWIETLGLVKASKELLHSTGLVPERHDRQTLRTIDYLTRIQLNNNINNNNLWIKN